MIREIRMIKVLMVAALCIAANFACGATINWTGATSTDWNTASNWSTGTVPGNGDVVYIANGTSFNIMNPPTISTTPVGTISSITFGTTQAATLTIASGATLDVSTITMTGTMLLSQVSVNGILNVDNISMSNATYNKIVLGSSSTMYLSGNITGGTLSPSSSGTIILDGNNTQSFGTGNFTIPSGSSYYIGTLDIRNTYYSSSTSRGVTFTGGTVNRVIVEPNAIFNANGSLVEGTNYHAIIGTNSLYISRSTFNLHATDTIDVTSTLQFTATNQVINMYKQNPAGTNICPNVIFTGTTIAVNGGPAPYSSTNANNAPTFLVRGNLDITSSTSTITYTGITAIDINGNFTGSTALACGSMPVNVGGSWTNTGSENMTGIVTYDGTTSSNTQIVSTGVTYGNNLVFTGASPKRVASGTLQVAGTLDNSAGSSVDFVTNKTTTLLNSTGAQTIKGGTAISSICSPDIVTGTIFYNLTLANGANTTTLNGNNNIAPNGVLTLSAANSTLDASASGTTFTLMSSAAGTASVAALPTGASITGSTINVQRYFKAQSTAGSIADYTRNYRLLSSPVNATSTIYNTNTNTSTVYSTLSYLSSASGVFTAGPGGTSSGFTVTNATPTIYLYKESLTASNKGFNTGNFKGITNMTGNPLTVYNDAGITANVSATLYPCNGYMLYYVGNNINNVSSSSPNSGGYNKSTRVGGVYAAVDASTSTAIGTLNQGSIPVKIWWSGSNTLGNVKTGYNLIGNPYASSIDWDTFSTTNSAAGIYGPNVAPNIYVFNYVSRNYGVYQTGLGGTGTNNATNVIASGQGFFVQVKTSSGSTLTFNEAAKTSSQPTGTSLLMAARPHIAAANTPFQVMRLKLVADSVDDDEIMVFFEKNALNTYEPYTDAERINGIGNTVSLASYAQGSTVPLSINHMGSIAADSRFKLYVNVTGSSGVDTLIASGLSSLDSRYDVYLLDHYKKDSLWLSQYPRYLFNINPLDSATFGDNRFEVVFHKKAEYTSFQLLSFSGVAAPSAARLGWKTDHEGTYTQFALQRREATGQYVTLTQLQANASGNYSYTDQTAAQGANLYRLQITDAFGTVSYSSVATVVLSSTPGVAAAANSEGVLVSVYPNPAASNIRVSVAEGEQSQQLMTTTADAGTQAGNLQVSILSMNGQVVGRFLGSSTNIASGDISALKPGTYILEASDSQGKKVYGRKRFVKF